MPVKKPKVDNVKGENSESQGRVPEVVTKEAKLPEEQKGDNKEQKGDNKGKKVEKKEQGIPIYLTYLKRQA